MTPTRMMLRALPLCVFALPALAAPRCGAHDRIVAQLADRYGESRQAIALDGANQVIEVFASTDTGSWTLLVTRADGQSCMLAAGQAFERLDEGPAVFDPEA
ncbi:hypothetical protein [Limimaricola hongkongensis]|uniref:Lipoprotein n=1 Tax=Limimaricola hongkongensis DSM 17492 TaxID=1122180 RepID=A0A017H947_9RHOB|nr:hypothetical protein [Limimaricola hongkongensis]EYD70658.1 hypothetical protein Lokhon_02299 [Limimaricola hongkongensis DSM 17492]